MNIIKIKALKKSEAYISVGLHSQGVCVSVEGYQSLLMRRRQKARGSPLIQSRPDMDISLPLHSEN